MGKYALLIGVSNYTAGLNNLPSAVRDVEALGQVLVNPEIGGFAESDVEILQDVDEKPIREAIYRLFTEKKRDDLLLFYFSGHGIVDNYNNFYLTGTATREEAPEPTAVPAEYLHNLMGRSRSKHQVLILDCCHSGSIAKGMRHKGGEKVQVLPKLGGEGRAILTASDSTEYAFEQEGFELSLYTHFLVEGLRTGAADRDGDGDISIDELYDYVRAKVRNTNDRMSPEFHPVREGHRIILAKVALDDPKLRFRREVEKVADRNNKGILFPTARNRLNRESQSLGLSPPEAAEIIQEVLRPYVEYAEKLEEYAQTLEEMITLRFPFDEVMAAGLEDYEIYLGLRPTDQATIKERILSPKQAEYERQRQLQHQEAPRQEATDKQRQAAKAERLRRQQADLGVTSRFVSRRNFLILGLAGGGLGGALVLSNIKFPKIERKSSEVESLIYDFGNGVTLDLVNIPAGKFMMGSNEFDSEKPIHEVTIKEAFWMGKDTVTNALWKAVMGTEPSKQYSVDFQGDNQPVVGVSWQDCNEFCKKISALRGREFRLPTEAEWEYACRANTTTPFNFGETITPALVNYNYNRGKTVDVGSFSPNAWGLYQMHGNVSQWCLDEFHENYNSKPESLKANGSEPWGEIKTSDNDSISRLVRGGHWGSPAGYCRSAYREKNSHAGGHKDGFRVVCVFQ